jgi:hypothetical protein
VSALVASLVNRLVGATITVSSEAAGYPKDYLAEPETPDIPWKTTALGDQWILVDFGAPVDVGVIGALYANFASARVRLNSANSWGGTTPYDQVVAIGVNPGNGRLCRWVTPGLTLQWLRVDIPDQATTDGASAYRLGGLHAGPVVSLRNYGWDYDPTPTQKTVVTETVGGAEQEAILGPQRMRIAGTRRPLLRTTLAGAPTGAPFLGDQAADWMAFDREWKAAGKALIVPRSDHPYWVGLLRTVSTSRRVNLGLSEDSFEWKEVA